MLAFMKEQMQEKNKQIAEKDKQIAVLGGTVSDLIKTFFQLNADRE